MKNKIVWGIILAIAVGVGVYFYKNGEEKADGASTLVGLPPALDAKNATYTIDGISTTLVNGFSEADVASDSAEKEVIRYFGNEVVHDLDDDGREDIVFLLTQQKGGSGTFYYVVAALNKLAGYEGSHAFLLGDRIAPQTTNIDEGTGAEGRQRQNVIVVNFAERRPSEPMTARPSVGKSVWLKLDPKTMQFGEVAQNFEGEVR